MINIHVEENTVTRSVSTVPQRKGPKKDKKISKHQETTFYQVCLESRKHKTWSEF